MAKTTEKAGSCFVVSPIGKPGSDIRKRADLVLKFVIAPVSRECGYGEPIRADNISELGMVTRQVIDQLLEAEMVVADLTDYNPNVFYEVAIRHAFRRPVVQIIQADQDIPFRRCGRPDS